MRRRSIVFGAIPLFLAVGCGPAAPPDPPMNDIAVESVAGTGRSTYDGEGKPAKDSALAVPIDVSFDQQGLALIIDFNNHRVRRVDAAGLISTVLGTGEEAYGHVNELATAFPVHHPSELAIAPDGQWVLAGYHDPRVLRVDASARVRVVAGIGASGDDGDGGDAQLARLDAPSGVAVEADGTTYVADELKHRVRRIDPAGIIHAFAGTGDRGYSGDGGPALLAKFNGPMRLSFDRRARVLYVADAGNHAVRAIDAAGIVTTVAGTGAVGFSGDGGAAAQAKLNRPLDVELLDDGSFLIADSENHRVRRVQADGTIRTLIGTGAPAEASPDHTTADRAGLHTPWGIGVDPEGRLWIADTLHDRVRRVDAALLGGARLR